MPIVNRGEAIYLFRPVPGAPLRPQVDSSNAVATVVIREVLQVTKTADPLFVGAGQSVAYTVTISNPSSIIAFNTTFTDGLAPGTTFIPGSLAIDGVPQPGYDPTVGFPLGLVAPGVTLVITYRARVHGSAFYRPLTNVAMVDFDYRAGSEDVVHRSLPASASVILLPGILSEFNLGETIELGACDPPPQTITDATAELAVVAACIIRTPSGRAVEGQALTGSALLVSAHLMLRVRYRSHDGSSHSVRRTRLFATELIWSLPPVVPSQQQLVFTVEDVSAVALGPRRLFCGVTAQLSYIAGQ